MGCKSCCLKVSVSGVSFHSLLTDSVYITGFDWAQEHIQQEWGVEPMGCDIVYTPNFRQICPMCFNFGFDQWPLSKCLSLSVCRCPRLPKWNQAYISDTRCGHQSPHQLQRAQPPGPQEVHRWPTRVNCRGPGDGEIQNRVWASFLSPRPPHPPLTLSTSGCVK